MLKLRDVLGRWEASELSQLEAAELLGMSERTFRRWSRRFEAEGETGLTDRRLGRRSGRAVADAAMEAVERLYRERYDGFTAKHFHEHLVREHKFAWGYTWTKTFLQSRGLPAKPRGADAWPGRRNSRCNRTKEHGLGSGPYAAFGPNTLSAPAKASGSLACRRPSGQNTKSGQFTCYLYRSSLAAIYSSGGLATREVGS